MSHPPDPVPIEALLRYRGWLRSLIRELVVDPDLADDVEQATWAVAIRRPPRHKQGLGAWLARVASSRLKDSYRQEQRRVRRETLVVQPGSHSSTEDLAGRAELQRRVADAVLALEEPYRAVVLHHYFDDRSAAEIADAMDVPLETVRTRLKRAKARLRTTLDREHGGERGPWVLAGLPLLREGVSGEFARAVTTGAVIMSAKKITVGLILTLLLLGTGWVAWELVDPGGGGAEVVPTGHLTAGAADQTDGAPKLVGAGINDQPVAQLSTIERTVVAVVVVDEHARPRVGASVRIKSLKQWWKDASPVREWPGRGVVTDSNGEAMIERNKSLEVIGVYDPADGASGTVTYPGDRYRFILRRPQPLRIVVRSESMDPVGNASVLVRDRTSTSRWGKGYRAQKETDADGVAEFLLPAGARSAWVRAYRADVGFGSVLSEGASGTKTLVLHGAHDVRFRIEGDPPAQHEPIEARLVVQRAGTPIWEFSRSVQVGEEVVVGQVPDEASLTLLASSPSGFVAHDDWDAVAGVRSIPLRRGCALAVHAVPPPAARFARAAVVPPDPYTAFSGHFSALQAFDPRGRAVFDALPAIEGNWRLIVLGEANHPFEVEPPYFDLQGLKPGGTKDIHIRMRPRRETIVEGRTTEVGSGRAIPFVRIALLSLRGRTVQISDAQGEFRFTTLRKPPFQVCFGHERHLPLSLNAERAADKSDGSIHLNAALKPLHSDDTYAVAVRVETPHGVAVPGVTLEWMLGKRWLPVGHVISSSERPIPVTRLPHGRAILMVTPPPGGGLGPFAREYYITEDRQITVALQSTNRHADVVVRLTNGESLREQFQVHLAAKRSHWAVLRDGEASVSNVPEGRYGLNLRIGPVTLPMGEIDVVAPLTVVERTYGKIAKFEVGLVAEGDMKVKCRAFLKRAEDGTVVVEGTLEGTNVLTWMVPEGTYELEVAGGGRHGARTVQVGKSPQVPIVRVPLVRSAGSAAIMLERMDSTLAELRFSLDGPTVRKWQGYVGLPKGWTRIDLHGLPLGLYELRVETLHGGPAGWARIDVGAGQAGPPIKVHMTQR